MKKTMRHKGHSFIKVRLPPASTCESDMITITQRTPGAYDTSSRYIDQLELHPSDEPRAGGTCTILKIKMGGSIFAMKRLNDDISLDVFRREAGFLPDMSHGHIGEVFASVIDTANRLNIILSHWREVRRNLENQMITD
jgi:hypothetical protein